MADPSPAPNALALPEKEPSPLPRDLVREMALDIGKEIAAYIERMYPEAVKAASSTFLLSVRNSIHNEIIAAIGTSDVDEIAARLARRKVERRRLRAMVKASRDVKPGEVGKAMDIVRGNVPLAPDF